MKSYLFTAGLLFLCACSPMQQQELAQTSIAGKACESPSTLKDAGECKGILVGNVLRQQQIANRPHTQALAKEFNYLTPENATKWIHLQPQRGVFEFSKADEIVSFAQKNDMAVKGHCLVWHSQLPQWVDDITDPNELKAVMENHIAEVMGHFKGRVQAWDVVNEAIKTDTDAGDGNPRMRNTVFQRLLGDEYLDMAFRMAREQDPNVKLYYNDYSIDADNDKADYLYEMLKGMVQRGVPIDGVGFQMHIGTPNNIATGAEVAKNMQRIADLGLEIVISEMDINLCGGRNAVWQQALYHDIVSACAEQPACKAITFWGLNDSSSWLNYWEGSGCKTEQPMPLLLDDNYQKKQTYKEVFNALIGR